MKAIWVLRDEVSNSVSKLYKDERKRDHHVSFNTNVEIYKYYRSRLGPYNLDILRTSG